MYAVLCFFTMQVHTVGQFTSNFVEDLQLIRERLHYASSQYILLWMTVIHRITTIYTVGPEIHTLWKLCSKLSPTPWFDHTKCWSEYLHLGCLCFTGYLLNTVDTTLIDKRSVSTTFKKQWSKTQPHKRAERNVKNRRTRPTFCHLIVNSS